MAGKKKEKLLQIVAGPNGSGKTTFAELYFHRKRGVVRYVNPDEKKQEFKNHFLSKRKG